MIYVDLRNNLLRTSPMSEDEKRQFLMGFAEDEEGKGFAQNFQFSGKVSILTLAKYLQKQVTIVMFTKHTWNEQKHLYDKQEIFVEYANGTQIPEHGKTIVDRVGIVNGSELQNGVDVLYDSKICTVIGNDSGGKTLLQYEKGSVEPKVIFESISRRQDFEAIFAYRDTLVMDHEWQWLKEIKKESDEGFNPDEADVDEDEDYDDM